MDVDNLLKKDKAKGLPKCLVCEKPLRKIKENDRYDGWTHKVHKRCYGVYRTVLGVCETFYD